MRWLTSDQGIGSPLQRRQQYTSKRAGLPRAQQRRELAATITIDDMRGQLTRLARDGRRDDCLALMQELGDWQGKNGNAISEALSMPYLGQQDPGRKKSEGPTGLHPTDDSA